MPWSYLQLEVIPDDRLIQPLVGGGNLTREQARAEVQSILDRAARLRPDLATIAATWRRGARDDTVYANSGLLVWAILEHQGDQMAAVRAWIDDYATPLRRAGLDVQIGSTTQPEEPR